MIGEELLLLVRCWKDADPGGYTQSDEMTLVISAASVVRGEQQCHSHSGRVVKLCCLSFVAVQFFMFAKRIWNDVNDVHIVLHFPLQVTCDIRLPTLFKPPPAVNFLAKSLTFVSTVSLFNIHDHAAN